jgi:hypothetical protein
MEGAYSEWVEGRMRTVQTLKGNASSFRSVTFPTNNWCGELHLAVGHYFLVVTSDHSHNLELGPSDRSIIDISYSYDCAHQRS